MDIAERNSKIKLKKRNPWLGPVQQKILLLLLGGMALSCTRSSRKQWQIVKGVQEGMKDINRQSAERAIEMLYESKLLEAKENGDGTTTLILNEDGEKRALTYRIHTMKVKPMRIWDRRWRIVLFDIPEDERETRNAFRDHLTELGFRKLQHSVGIHPFDCKDEIDFFVELLDIRKYVRFIVADSIDNETYWKNKFKLE